MSTHAYIFRIIRNLMIYKRKGITEEMKPLRRKEGKGFKSQVEEWVLIGEEKISLVTKRKERWVWSKCQKICRFDGRNILELY